ncbi:hypothetical protein YC2023_059271 [Brassica napus]
MCYLIIRQIHPRRLLRRQSEVPVSPSVPAPRRVRKSPLSFDTIFRQVISEDNFNLEFLSSCLEFKD